MKKRTKRILAALLSAAVCVSVTPAGAVVNSNTEKPQAEAAAPAVQDNRTAGQEKTGWDGATTEDVYEGKNFRVTFTLAEHWEGGYNAGVEIENTGDTVIENWMLEFPYAGKITNIWNAAASKKTADGYVIKNAAWNQDIEAGKRVSFGFSGQENFPGFPKEYRLKGSLESVLEKDYEVSYHADSEWENGFTGEIEIKNNMDKVLEDWILEFDFDRTITNIWNGVIESHEGKHYVIKNAGYNSNIPASGSVSIGFTGQDGKKGNEPSGYKLYSCTDSAGTDGTDNDSMGKDDKETVLAINTDGFTYNENADWYIVDKKTDTLSGTLSTPEKVKELSCEVTDIKGNSVLSCSIGRKEHWKLEDFGLSIGYNKVVVTALLDSGKKVTETAELMNYESSNLDGINADMTDSDGDGLCNYYEGILGTDKNKADTDGDGLSDYDEFIKIGTDPVLKDTDSDGTTDDKEDTDKDGLNNLAEIKHGTNCFLEDTDGDGLQDGEEVILYHTDPLVADTDKDGLNDREDGELGFDPTNPDTDGDGTLDGKEKVLQTCTQKVDTEEKAGITEVSVTLACDGYIDNRVSIMDTYDLDMRSSDVVGLVGVPAEITTDVKFKTADITFTYDESALGASREDDLCMMWYDEENDRYVLLEDSVLDKKNNTITYTTTHFSTYLVVDKQIWLDNLRMAPDYVNSEKAAHYDIAFAVDVSLSMQNDNRLPMAKAALNAFIDALQDGDRAGLIRFNRNAVTVQGITHDKELLKTGVESLRLAYDNSVAAGIRAGLDMLGESSSINEKILIVICDGDVDDCSALTDLAVDMGIRIYCINVTDGDSGELENIAKDTGGLYYYAATSADIAQAVSDLQGDTIESIDMTDSDGDGLYDVYETEGMLLSNGQVVHTDPHKADSDGDGTSDYDALGGDPVIESYMIGGNVYSCTLFHSEVYGKLSKKFVYVDGTLNRDGKQYFGKMDYVPYSNRFLYYKYNIKRGKYSKEKDRKKEHTFADEARTAYGDARLHGLFADRLHEVPLQKIAAYAAKSTAIAMIVESVRDPVAFDCFCAFVSGKGGEEDAWEEGFTRKTVPVAHWILKKITVNNSFGENFNINMNKAMRAAESVLNKYNKEVYLSVSPDKKMNGGIYYDKRNPEWSSIPSIAFNLAAYGTFNDADAGVTLHAVYNSETGEYVMDYRYSLIDYYDFSKPKTLKEQDMLGLARGYELYGNLNGTFTWKKGEERQFYSSWLENILEHVNDIPIVL